MLDGNTKKWSGVAGIGPLTSKLTLEGPLQKDKTTLVAAFRTTYSDWLLNTLPASSAYNNSSANFYDGNLRITHKIDDKNTLNIMGYYSGDQFRLDNDTTYKYSNASTNIKWKHIFNNRSNALFTAGIDRYKYNISDTRIPPAASSSGSRSIRLTSAPNSPLPLTIRTRSATALTRHTTNCIPAATAPQEKSPS
jgi:hypothetical protein